MRRSIERWCPGKSRRFSSEAATQGRGNCCLGGRICASALGCRITIFRGARPREGRHPRGPCGVEERQWFPVGCGSRGRLARALGRAPGTSTSPRGRIRSGSPRRVAYSGGPGSQPVPGAPDPAPSTGMAEVVAASGMAAVLSGSARPVSPARVPSRGSGRYRWTVTSLGIPYRGRGCCPPSYRPGTGPPPLVGCVESWEGLLVASSQWSKTAKAIEVRRSSRRGGCSGGGASLRGLRRTPRPTSARGHTGRLRDPRWPRVRSAWGDLRDCEQRIELRTPRSKRVGGPD